MTALLMRLHRRRADLPPELSDWARQIHAEVFCEPDGSVRVEGLSFFRVYNSLDDLARNIYAPRVNGCSGRNRNHNSEVHRGYDEALAREAAAARAAK